MTKHHKNVYTYITLDFAQSYASEPFHPIGRDFVVVVCTIAMEHYCASQVGRRKISAVKVELFTLGYISIVVVQRDLL